MVSYSAIETIVTGESMIDVVERNLGKKFETEDEKADDSNTGMWVGGDNHLFRNISTDDIIIVEYHKWYLSHCVQRIIY